MGGVEPMARVGLGVIHVRLAAQPADLRQAVGADADHAAPLVIDAYVGQFGEHLEHLRPHVVSDVLRVSARVVAGTAEQQPVVG